MFNEVFFLPKLTGKNSIVKGVAGGWELNTIFTAENGNSMSVYQSGVSAATTLLDPTAPVNNLQFNGNSFPCVLGSLSGTGYNNNQRPNVVPGVGCNSNTSGVQRMNPNAFTLIGYVIGTVGNAPRGICEGPHYVNADIGVYKNWQVKKKSTSGSVWTSLMPSTTRISMRTAFRALAARLGSSTTVAAFIVEPLTARTVPAL